MISSSTMVQEYEWPYASMSGKMSDFGGRASTKFKEVFSDFTAGSHVRSCTTTKIDPGSHDTIEATDLTCDDTGDKPYVLQHRIPGRDLDSSQGQFSHSQREYEKSETFDKDTSSVKSSVAGTIETAIDGS